jgi:hypothetical protein
LVVTWTYNAGTNTATASGAGSTNFAGLVAADVAGGWGKFTADASGTQILCQGKIVKEETEPYQMALAVVLLQRQRDKRMIKALQK